MKKTTRWLGIGLAALLLGLAGGGGFALYQAYQRSANYYLAAGENSYNAGVEAFAKGDDANAMLRFHEAQLQADLAVKEVEAVRAGQKDFTAEQQNLLTRQEGLAYWLKLKALRARCVSKVRGEGKALPELEGVAPDRPRDYFAKLLPSRLPDEAARQEAVGCLRLAALRLPDVEEIQRDAANQEMQFEPKQWPVAERIASHLLALQPKDERAHYLLARYEFEQPQTATAGPADPLPPLKRSRERMQKALTHLEAVKAAEKSRRWRTVYLEAQIQSWLAAYWRQPSHRKPLEEQQALTALKELLFAEPDGALTRAAEAESFGPLSRLDTEGLLFLHQVGLDLAIEAERAKDKQAGGAAAGDPANVGRLLAALTKTTEKIAAKEPNPVQLGLCFDALAQAGPRAQPFAAKDAAVWTQYLSAAQRAAQAAAAQQQGEVVSFLRLAEVCGRESERLGKEGQSAPRDELRRQALAWIDAGLKQAQGRKLPAGATLPLHETALRLKAQMGAKREELAPHLAMLRESDKPAFQAKGLLLEGAFQEREGRLEKARDLMERAAHLGAGTDTARRAHAALANLQLALNQPRKTLASLAEVEKAYGRWEQLADEERAWLFEFLRSPQEVQLLKLHAHLACAAEAWRLLALQGAGAGAAPLEEMKQHELEAARLLGQFSGLSPLNRLAREKLVAHLAGTRRLDQATEQIEALRKDYPESVSVFKLEQQTALAKAAPADRANALARIELKIRQFMQNNPTNQQAKLLWAEWLLGTGRAADAAAFLGDAAQFPAGAADRQAQRLRTIAQLSAGGKDASAVQPAAAKDPLIDLAVIQAAGPGDEKQRQVGDALARYENNGLFRCAAAKLAAERRDYAEATRGYASALEITCVRAMARAGLQQALAAFAQQNPLQARELITQLLQEQPAEPALLVGYAECCLTLGELGDPAAKGTKIQDLATALAAFEQAAGREAPNDPSALWMKAQFWQRANRPDLARTEIARLLARFPEHEGALALAAQLTLADGGAEAARAAQPFIDSLRRRQPDAPLPALLQAQQQNALGLKKEAQATLAGCVKRHPKCAAAHAALVELLCEAGGAAAAMPAIRAWRQELPEDLMACQAEMRHLAASGQLKEAQALRDQTLAELRARLKGARPEELPAVQQAETLATLALCRGLLLGKAYGEAEAWLRQILEPQPECEGALLLLGDVHLAQLRQATNPADRQAFAKQAHAAFAKVCQQRKGHLIAGNNLAWLLATESGDPEEALRLLNEVRANRHTQRPLPAEMLPAEVLDTFGLAYAKLNRPGLAAEQTALFQAARRRYPNDPRFCLHLGRAAALAGQPQEAEQQFAAALALAGKANPGVAADELPRFQAEVAAARQQTK